MSHITASQFTDRFTALVLAGRELPKKQLDRHIVLISAILRIEPGRQYSEKEINEECSYGHSASGVASVWIT